MKKFEYLTLSYSGVYGGGNPEHYLNILGEKGWELCCYDKYLSKPYIFKRLKE